MNYSTPASSGSATLGRSSSRLSSVIRPFRPPSSSPTGSEAAGWLLHDDIGRGFAEWIYGPIPRPGKENR
jgi:hypothetical protein